MATDAGECKQYCGMPLLTDLDVMMRINPLALIHGLREFVTVVYEPVMSFVFPDVQVKAYRMSVRKNSGARLGVDGFQQQLQVPNGPRRPFPHPV